jgi:hypothetical protein
MTRILLRLDDSPFTATHSGGKRVIMDFRGGACRRVTAATHRLLGCGLLALSEWPAEQLRLVVGTLAARCRGKARAHPLTRSGHYLLVRLVLVAEGV